MKFNTKGGFSLMESLVGFVLFSLILMIYLPGMNQELVRIDQLRDETAEWRVFYDLVNEQFSGQPLSHRDEIIQRFNAQTMNPIDYFKCSNGQCSIHFVDGSGFDVGLQRGQ